jgi:hypothetical protein
MIERVRERERMHGLDILKNIFIFFLIFFFDIKCQLKFKKNFELNSHVHIMQEYETTRERK